VILYRTFVVPNLYEFFLLKTKEVILKNVANQKVVGSNWLDLQWLPPTVWLFTKHSFKCLLLCSTERNEYRWINLRVFHICWQGVPHLLTTFSFFGWAIPLN